MTYEPVIIYSESGYFVLGASKPNLWTHSQTSQGGCVKIQGCQIDKSVPISQLYPVHPAVGTIIIHVLAS